MDCDGDLLKKNPPSQELINDIDIMLVTLPWLRISADDRYATYLFAGTDYDEASTGVASDVFESDHEDRPLHSSALPTEQELQVLFAWTQHFREGVRRVASFTHSIRECILIVSTRNMKQRRIARMLEQFEREISKTVATESVESRLAVVWGRMLDLAAERGLPSIPYFKAVVADFLQCQRAFAQSVEEWRVLYQKETRHTACPYSGSPDCSICKYLKQQGRARLGRVRAACQYVRSVFGRAQ